jgi:antitoxin (DNA-binding transcriptional repressor) of toxin-antitoxin stability system
MDRQITERQLHNDSGEVMRSLDRGQSFIVTRDGVPIAELTPVRRKRFVTAAAAVAAFRGAPAIEGERFRADLDRAVSQGSTPRT